MLTGEINIRDPFVLAEGGRFYLYGTRGATCWGEADGFDVYTGDDLVHWDGPRECFHRGPGFWADRNFWAPEVFRRGGAWWMFASFKAEGVCRGTAVLRAESPLGPFEPWSDGPVTPRAWECLDGTFFEDGAGRPWMVFCHEWLQCGDGEVCAMPLQGDLRAADGPPRVLFRASEAPWTRPVRHSSGRTGYVTDGPFLWRTAAGELICLWASFSEGGYTEGVARSSDGSIGGTFTQLPPLFDRDGGHGMVFRGPGGRLMLALHSPNGHLLERPVFRPVREAGGTLVPDEWNS